MAQIATRDFKFPLHAMTHRMAVDSLLPPFNTPLPSGGGAAIDRRFRAPIATHVCRA
jgi:hypothetical protein